MHPTKNNKLSQKRAVLKKINKIKPYLSHNTIQLAKCYTELTIKS